jgi:hypothetical protein
MNVVCGLWTALSRNPFAGGPERNLVLRIDNEGASDAMITSISRVS